MTSATEARSAIYIEETYTYNIEIGSFTAVSCTATSGRVRVTVPYDGRLLANAPAGEPLTLGQLRLSAPTYPVSPDTHLVQLPIDATLPELIRSNREAVWDWGYTPPAPRDTLLAVEAAIVDGAALDPSMDDKQLYKLLFDNTDTFVNDLRLQLNLWVPRPNASLLTGARGRELAMSRSSSPPALPR